jgi:hypothetical protein
MLKVNYDLRQQDYLDYLIPFLRHILSKHRSSPVTADDAKTLLEGEFGLRIPRPAVELGLKRMVKKGGELRKEHHVFIITDALKESRIVERRADAERSTAVVVNGLRRFANERFGKEWTEEFTVELLIEYIRQFSIECLATFVLGTPLPEIPQKANEDLVLVSLFVKEAYAAADNLFESTVDLVKGHMLANALLCPDLESIQRKFEDVRFFFDTRLVLSALRLDGDENYRAAYELIQLLKNLGAKTCVFAHTVDEINAVFHYCETHLSDPSTHRSVILEMRRTGKTASDLALVRLKLPELLKACGLEIQQTPSYAYTKLQIDEQAMGKIYESVVPWIRPQALSHDVNSVRSIYVLRMGIQPRRLEDSLATFVTSNLRLAESAYHYGKDFEASKEVSTVITDFSLSNVAWLKAPVAAPNLPRQEVIAYCFAALQPEEGFWAKYLEELDKLRKDSAISERDHQLLRFNLRAEEELMKMTLGSDDALTGSNILQIRDKIVAELTSEADKKLQSERERLAAAQRQLEEAKQSEADRIRSSLKFAGRVGNVVGAVVWTILWCLIAVGSFYSAILSPLDWPTRHGMVRALINGSVVFAVLFGALSSIYGFSLVGVRKKVSSYATAWVFCQISGG